MTTRTLKPLKEDTKAVEEIERRIKAVFRKMLYGPILRELKLPPSTLKNAAGALIAALRAGRVVYERGRFNGKFGAAVTKELKALGATWDGSAFRLPSAKLPDEVHAAIAASAAVFQKRLAAVDARIAQILPEEIADRIKLGDIFDTTLWKVDQKIEGTLKGITVLPDLPPERRRRLADEWQNNMELSIKTLADEEIVKLRKMVQANVFAGNRYETLISRIEKSYGVTAGKAKFLARQETNLLQAKFKASRYQDAGIAQYQWGCVAGSSKHPVRPRHKELEGSIQRWDNPPITSELNQPIRRNNPQEDYNCRCFAKPVINFKEPK